MEKDYLIAASGMERMIQQSDNSDTRIELAKEAIRIYSIHLYELESEKRIDPERFLVEKSRFRGKLMDLMKVRSAEWHFQKTDHYLPFEIFLEGYMGMMNYLQESINDIEETPVLLNEAISTLDDILEGSKWFRNCAPIKGMISQLECAREYLEDVRTGSISY